MDNSENIENIMKAAEKLDNLKKSFAGAIGTFSEVPKELASMSDDFVKTTIQLDNIEDMKGSMLTTETLQTSVMATANRLGATYENVTNQVVTLGTTMNETFSSKDEIMGFVELMNEMAAIGGNTGDSQASFVNNSIANMANGPISASSFGEMQKSAPMMAEVVEDYMVNVNGAKGSLDEWLAQGLITADVLKNAMFNSSAEIEARFAEVPMTWSQIWTTATNGVLSAMQPLLEGINLLAQNWSTVGPIVVMLTSIIGAYVIALNAATVAKLLSTIATNALTIALNNIPLMWIATIIGIVVALIYDWVQSVGGLGMAWLIVKDKVLTAVDTIKNGAMNIMYSIMSVIFDITLKVSKFVQDIINGVIGLINSVIEEVNDKFNQSINVVGEVTFADDFEKGTQYILDEFKAKIETSEREAMAAEIRRETEIRREQKAQQSKAQENAAGVTEYTIAEHENTKSIADNTKNIYNNTRNIANTYEAGEDKLSDEARNDLLLVQSQRNSEEYARNVNIEFVNNNSINSDMDIDGIFNQFTDKLREAMDSSGEGAGVFV